MTHHYRHALVLFFIAGVTDFLDGFLARAMRSTSKAGALLDPLADKALLVLTYLSLAFAGVISWWVAAVVVGRDAAILAGAAVLYWRIGRREFPPSKAGKVSTAVQILCAAAWVCVEAGLLPRALGRGLTVGVTAATVASGLDYFMRGWRMMAAVARQS